MNSVGMKDHQAMMTGLPNVPDEKATFSFVANFTDIFPGVCEIIKRQSFDTLKEFLSEENKKILEELLAQKNPDSLNSEQIEDMAAKVTRGLSDTEKYELYGKMTNEDNLCFPATGRLDRLFTGQGVEASAVKYHVRPNPDIVGKKLEGYSVKHIKAFVYEAWRQKIPPFPSDHFPMTASIHMKDE